MDDNDVDFYWLFAVFFIVILRNAIPIECACERYGQTGGKPPRTLRTDKLRDTTDYLFFRDLRVMFAVPTCTTPEGEVNMTEIPTPMPGRAVITSWSKHSFR